MDPVRDICPQHRHQVVHNIRSPWRAEDDQGSSWETRNPSSGNHVVEISQMVTMQMGEEDRRDLTRAKASSGKAHQHPTTCVYQQVDLPRLNKR
ncbi:unannotated protein [freshwater metagenome]|uniref:Unannotated protein n=1 Tax=freshwater metagenome TaxID=449393 RepID=A0A6J7SPA7_9ZZZZ